MKTFLKASAALMLCIILCFSSVIADNEIAKAPERNQAVRVMLTRLSVTDRIDLTLASPYQATTASGAQLGLPEGTQLCVLLSDGAMQLFYKGMSVNCGKSITLNRAGEGSRETGIRKTNFAPLYTGDLALIVHEGCIQPILSINVEDYLLGVVPYEMSDSFPMEALKAQAVAARTYALRRQGSHQDFDLYDTTADQVFHGYVSGYTNAEKAVQETRGVCGFYKNKLAMCYYAATNGGQTEKVETVWPEREKLPYYASVEDPYDLENPASNVQTYKLAKNCTEPAQYTLRKLFADELKNELTALGLDPAAESIRLDKVIAVSVDSPNRTGSKLMTKLHMTVRISGRTKNIILPDTDTEEVSLNIGQATSAPTAVPATVQPTATPAPVYGKLTPIDRDFNIDIDIFPTAEAVFGLNLSGNSANEIWTVTESSKEFVIEARRYGHGVGMSQRGAQWMALAYGKSYLEILAFYYPGMDLKQYPTQSVVYAQSLPATPGPAASPTPRPTLMPLTLTPAPGQNSAIVSEIASDSSLNLRSAPTLNADIVMRLYKNQKLIILEHCDDGWVKVTTGSITGYVMEKFLTID